MNLLKRLFCFHRWKFVGGVIDDTYVTNDGTYVGYDKYKCVKCGKEHTEMFRYNPHIILADDGDDEYDRDKTYTTRELNKKYLLYGR